MKKKKFSLLTSPSERQDTQIFAWFFFLPYGIGVVNDLPLAQAEEELPRREGEVHWTL